MRYQIKHTTTYTYSQFVTLEPHLVRLRPRCDGWQSLQSFSLEVSPDPIACSSMIELDGNAIAKVWFAPEQTRHLEVRVRSTIETCCTNPFSYLLEPWAIHLPIDYPTSLLSQLRPYLEPAIDPVVMALAQDICHHVEGNVVAFLGELNQRIYTTCQYIIRDTGDPLPPGLTWTQQSGSCRDLTVLFMAACRVVGLASRFVSGYQEGDPDSNDRHLHAWAEVYLPGAGWRGYDPTQGLVVSDRHIALVSSSVPRRAAPISGAFRGIGAQASLEYQLSIQPIPAPGSEQ